MYMYMYMFLYLLQRTIREACLKDGEKLFLLESSGDKED